jgi:uncharacterized protein YjbI with pentapeptide repeats
MKITVSLAYIMLVLAGIILIPNAFAENVPDWVKNTAGWWADDQIDDSAFLQGIQYLIKEGIMVIPPTEASESASSQEVPSWIKNNAGWWAGGQINDSTFVSGIQYLIKSGVIVVTQTEKSMTETTVKISGYSDWLINNPSWEAAREFCNCPFDKFDLSYLKKKAKTCDGCESQAFINSHGFRSEEFSNQKPNNTYRIFALGGSSTFGLEVYDDETWPAYLQKKFDEIDLNVNIEVINVGISAANSGTERKLIEDRIVNLDPDLIIMYDGWNDAGYPINWNRPSPSLNESIQNWTTVCELGNKKRFDTIITIQPIIGTGDRVLTDHELKYLGNRTFDMKDLQRKLSHYVEFLPELNKVCTKAVDFRGIFDYTQEPVYVDWGHPSSIGYEIIAENMFIYALPVVLEKINGTYETESTKYPYNSGQFTIFAVGADLSGKNFGTMDLSNAIFDNADLGYANFDDAILKETRFVRANLSFVDFTGKDLTGLILVGVDLSDTKLAGADLSFANLVDANLSGSDLTDTKLVGANLNVVNLEGANVKNTDFTSADLSGANLIGTNLKDAKLDDAIFDGVKFDGFDISLGSMQEINFHYTDLSQAILTNADLSDMDLSFTNLTGQDLSGHDIANTILTGATLTDVILPSGVLSGKNFEWTKFHGVDLSGEDMSHSKFQYASFDNANMENVNLSNSELIQVDFTKIKNKSLAGTNLFGTSLAYSDLSGVNLSGANLAGTNFSKAHLSGQDFTAVSDEFIDGSLFIESILHNSNFEGVTMSPKESYIQVFENKAYLYAEFMDTIGRYNAGELFEPYEPVIIINMEVQGNDLAVNYVFYNNFADANLENANFKNAKLWHVNFYLANLTNVDLSGADLSHANLDGANLQGAVLDNTILTGVNLNCINHPICKNS